MLESRNDKGGLWENFCVLERMKYNFNNRRFVNTFFIRTYSQQEVDYVEEIDGKLHFFEFKYSTKRKAKVPSEISSIYNETKIETINPKNIYNFLK